MKNIKGFTLIELAVTLVVIIILMSVSVPIYRSNLINYKRAEGYALLASIRSAQEQYYAEYGNFLLSANSSAGDNTTWTGTFYTYNEKVLGINAKTNKYFTKFCIRRGNNVWDTMRYAFCAEVHSEEEKLTMIYNLNDGVTIK